MIDTWPDRLRLQEKRGFENYKIITINLSSARANQWYNFAGDFLYVESVSSPSAAATIKLNRDRLDSLSLRLNTVIKSVFTGFYITNTAQAGESLTLIVGIDFEKYAAAISQQPEPQTVVELTHASANTNVTPASAPARIAIIKAHSRNTDIAWIDFGQAAVQDSCLPLEPGDTITVPISNLDQINANFEVGGEFVWIVNLL
ncbi:MAG: hypothetical protein DRP65_04145 [Planctomycetota bacterium]|nr:MAG: hypothetical protein DRP65_04145 [Planctomycetota bacterium]